MGVTFRTSDVPDEDHTNSETFTETLLQFGIGGRSFLQRICLSNEVTMESGQSRHSRSEMGSKGPDSWADRVVEPVPSSGHQGSDNHRTGPD